MSIMDMIQGGGPGGPPQGPPPGGPDPSGQSQGDDTSAIIKEMLGLLDEYKQTEQDEQDLLLAEKIGTQLQQLLAQNQKQLDDAMTGKISPKLLRKQYPQGP